jgi:NADPH:quinone reductase-like Zn-dependent oxidoreductase
MASLKPDASRKRAHLDRIVSLVTSGAVKLPQITTYALADAAAAHRVSEGRHLRGKLVFKVR